MMKIKCLLVAMAISVLVNIPAQAQDEYRHEFSASYGAVSNSTWLEAAGEFISAMFGRQYSKCSYAGPMGLEYYYHITPLVGVGAVGVFTKYNQEEKYKDEVTSIGKNSYFTLMPSVKFNWLRRENWGLYSKLAAGATLRNSHLKEVSPSTERTTKDKNGVFFNFQISAIGIEAGRNHVFGFAEVGVGEQGIGLAGVRFKF